MSEKSDNRVKADVLAAALPWLKAYNGKIVVIKYGGNAMTDETLKQAFAEDIAFLRFAGFKPVVVHGGGPQISSMMARLGKATEFRDGLRVTDAETVDIARMVLVGKVNRDIVASINVHGPVAVGLSGEDAGLIAASARHADLGFVGDVAAVNPTIVERLLAEHLIPVVSTIGSGPDGQAYNINADTVAGALAGGYAGNKAQNKYGERRPGQHIIVQLDNGVAVGITQAGDSGLRVGDRVRIDGMPAAKPATATATAPSTRGASAWARARPRPAAAP